MRPPIRIVIAEDYPLFMEGICLMLEKESSIEIAGEAVNGKELVAVTDKVQPDVVITDIEMPFMNGIEATREIRKKYPAMAILALTMYGEERLIVDMLEAGSNGYLLKNTRKEELLLAIRTVHSGRNYFCSSTSMRLSKMIARSKAEKLLPEISLNEKETDIIRLICEQYPSKQIAEMTGLNHRTVEKYRNQIMEKTGAKNMAGIVIYAIRSGLFKP
jgi:DNA-binding NarL/FixJ family response regulator